MSWFSLAVSCAVFTASTAALSKLLLRKNGIFLVGWIRFLISLPIFFALLYIYRPGFHFPIEFWKTVAFLLPLEFAAFLIFLKALKLSPLSLSFPFLGFTPVFTVFFSYILLGEKASRAGLAGVILVSAGAYLLNANALKEGILEPVKSIYREKGSLLMLLVAFIYSITSVLGKKGVLLSSGPLSFVGVYYGIFFLLLTPLALAESRALKIRISRKDIFLSLFLGVVFAAAMLSHFNAIVLANVAYVISVKRLSLILSVLYGAIIFKEKNIAYRLLGSLVMLGGALILLLAQ